MEQTMNEPKKDLLGDLKEILQLQRVMLIEAHELLEAAEHGDRKAIPQMVQTMEDLGRLYESQDGVEALIREKLGT